MPKFVFPPHAKLLYSIFPTCAPFLSRRPQPSEPCVQMTTVRPGTSLIRFPSCGRLGRRAFGSLPNVASHPSVLVSLLLLLSLS